MSKKPFFSIVIPTLNEEKYLPLLLGDLSKQTFTDFEIIHIDGSSEDKTVKQAQAYSRRLLIQTQIVKKRNVAFQRNAGAKLAKGEWVIFMDADNRLPIYFLLGIKYQLEKNPTVGVFTTWVKVGDQFTLNKAVNKTMENAMNLGYETLMAIGKEAAVGALIGTKKSAVKRVAFKEKEKIFEDAFFVRDCIAAGYSFAIFREPKYTFSLRRLKKEGSLKMARIIAAAQLDHILGKNFEEQNHGYVMMGGTYYDQPYQSPLINLQKFIERASADQLKRARKILKGLRELEL